LLLSENDCKFGSLQLDQAVETPIGAGFGASAASATSAVYAAAYVAGIVRPRKELALYAHRAEILEQTGLGTVSVVFDSVGAGAITIPGPPGEAKFITVDVPKDLKLVTAFIAPYDKKDALSSRAMGEKINSLGNRALRSFLSDPTIDALASEGERFSRNLGLETPEVRKLIRIAKSAGATHASQNMIGYSVHSLVPIENSTKVSKALRAYSPDIRVDTFAVGKMRAGVKKSSRRSRDPS
jgi:pantoate kinase